MSSPAKRRTTRSSQSATPRATRSSQAGPSSATPRQTRASQLASSPLFYESSSPANGANPVSSPLRQMSNTQSTANHGNAPSSPLRQQTETQSDADRTPRPNGRSQLIGGMAVTKRTTFVTNADSFLQTRLPSAMPPVLAQVVILPSSPIFVAKAVSSSSARNDPSPVDPVEATSTATLSELPLRFPAELFSTTPAV